MSSGSVDGAPPPDDLPRADLGPYRLEGLLGRGGMGAVYRAVDERLGRRVAVKHLPPALAGDERRRQRFRRESSALARLNHPAIVQIFDLLHAEGSDWIVMEFVPGSTLREGLRDGPLPLREVLDLGRQIADGLAQAHEQGVLHRDLKTDNIMLPESSRGSGDVPRVKILDFGLAKLLEDDAEATVSESGQIVGTFGTMSPEQARGAALDARSDLFSLGVVLYEMTAGERPFRGDSGLEILQKVVGRRHPPVTEWRPEAPPRLVGLIDRLLEKSPEHRPESARAVAAELRQIAADPERSLGASLADSRPTLDPVGPVGRVDLQTAETLAETLAIPRPRPHRRKLLVAGCLAVVLSVALLALAFSRRDVEPADSGSPAETIGTTAETDPHTLFHQGMDHLERYDEPDRIARAIAAFEAALTKHESSAPAHAGLALAYWKQFLVDRDPLRLEQAEAVAERAVQLDEHLAIARIARGTVYAEAGRTEEALEELEAASLLAPKNAAVERGRGLAHRNAGEIPAAIAAFERAVELDPTDRFLRDELGALYYRQGRYDEAEEQFLERIEIAPDGTHGYRNLSAIYYMQGRLPEAKEALQRALTIAPDHSLYSNLGTILFAQGLYLPAARAYEKALDHGGGYVYQYWANLADAYRQAEGREEEARSAYRQAIRLLEEKRAAHPERDHLAGRLALYLAKSGGCEEALDVLATVDLGDAPAAGHHRAAVTFEVCGERAAALDTLAAALRAGFSSSEIGRDPELLALRSDPGYQRLLTELEDEGALP